MYLPDDVRPQNKGYGEAGASWRKRAVKGFNAPSGSSHEDIDFNNYTLRQRSRMLYMAAPVATSAIKTNRTNVVGVGLRLKSRIDREVLGLTPEQAEEWQKTTEREFNLWAKDKRACDATGMNNFYGLQQLALVSWLLSGDCIGLIKQYPVTRLLPYSLRVHLIESDRIATPGGYGSGGSVTYTTGRNPDNGNTIYDGVEVDSNGMVVAYHIRSNYPFELGAPTTTWARVLAYQEHTGLPNVLHIIDTERPDQYRGVSYLAQVIEPLLQIRRYTESGAYGCGGGVLLYRVHQDRGSDRREPVQPDGSGRAGRTERPQRLQHGAGPSQCHGSGGKRGVCKPNAPERQF